MLPRLIVISPFLMVTSPLPFTSKAAIFFESCYPIFNAPPVIVALVLAKAPLEVILVVGAPSPDIPARRPLPSPLIIASTIIVLAVIVLP